MDLLLSRIFFTILLLGALYFVWTQPVSIKKLYEKYFPKTSDTKPSIEIKGDVTVSNNQSGGITAHTVNINEQRTISRKFESKRDRRGDVFILQIILNQTKGVWNQGELFGIQVKTSGPYKGVRFISGMPMGLMNVQISENKENGFYSFSTTSAPLNGVPIILEITSDVEINIEQVNVTPRASE